MYNECIVRIEQIRKKKVLVKEIAGVVYLG